ncbi:MAG: AAA family ATPase [Verrucomicrobia bacterium]|nr:MAG: AAA family ATPase [Verrucomicrobiota bacterium]
MNQDEIKLAEKQINRLRECCRALQEQMATVLIGQNEVVRLLLTGLMSGGHMLVIGVPGLAKTMMVKALSDLLGWNFRRIQFTPDLMPADITGTEILQSDESGHRRELVFHRGPVFANLILADEINRTPPKTQAALLEAMQELAVTVNGKTYRLESPFIVVATQNPIEQEGTYPLPEAQLDRFMLSIQVDYPEQSDELSIAARPIRSKASQLSPLAKKEEFESFTDIVDQTPISRHVLEHAVAISTASRPKNPGADDFIRKYVAWGAGPRATQHLVTAAKASALLDGRPSPEINDLNRIAAPVLRHRIIPNYNALGEGIEADAIIEHLLETVGEPVAA